MRLIDADEFKRQIAGMAIVTGYSAQKANKMCELIDNQPTAYDINNVVEELKCDRCESCNFLEVCAGSKFCGKCREKAIEIVKQGYVSDDVCEWKMDNVGASIGCRSDLHHTGYVNRTYCPYCGKKIKVVEQMGKTGYSKDELNARYYQGFADGVKEIEAKYRDLEEQGLLLRLPCKNWMDIVFGKQETFFGIDESYIENPIREITVDSADRFTWYDGWKTLVLNGADENGLDWEFSPEDIGKTVFLTKSEAKMKELRGNNGKSEK